MDLLASSVDSISTRSFGRCGDKSDRGWHDGRSFEDVKFCRKTTFEQRVAETERIRRKYPDRLPVIIGRSAFSFLGELSKTKFLIPGDARVKILPPIIASKLRPESSTTSNKLVILCSDLIQAAESPIAEVYEKYHNADGFLYITYCTYPEAQDELVRSAVKLRYESKDLFSAVSTLKRKELDISQPDANHTEEQSPCSDSKSGFQSLDNERLSEGEETLASGKLEQTKVPEGLRTEDEVVEHLKYLQQQLYGERAQGAVKEMFHMVTSMLQEYHTATDLQELRQELSKDDGLFEKKESMTVRFAAHKAPSKTDRLAYSQWMDEMHQQKEGLNDSLLDALTLQVETLQKARAKDCVLAGRVDEVAGYIDTTAAEQLKVLQEEEDGVRAVLRELNHQWEKIQQQHTSRLMEMQQKDRNVTKSLHEKKQLAAANLKTIKSLLAETVGLLHECSGHVGELSACKEEVAFEEVRHQTVRNTTFEKHQGHKKALGHVQKSKQAVALTLSTVHQTAKDLRCGYKHREEVLADMEKDALIKHRDIFQEQYQMYSRWLAVATRFVADKQNKLSQLEKERLDKEQILPLDFDGATSLLAEDLTHLDTQSEELKKLIHSKTMHSTDIRERQDKVWQKGMKFKERYSRFGILCPSLDQQSIDLATAEIRQAAVSPCPTSPMSLDAESNSLLCSLLQQRESEIQFLKDQLAQTQGQLGCLIQQVSLESRPPSLFSSMMTDLRSEVGTQSEIIAPIKVDTGVGGTPLGGSIIDEDPVPDLEDLVQKVAYEEGNSKILGSHESQVIDPDAECIYAELGNEMPHDQDSNEGGRDAMDTPSLSVPQEEAEEDKEGEVDVPDMEDTENLLGAFQETTRSKGDTEWGPLDGAWNMTTQANEIVDGSQGIMDGFPGILDGSHESIRSKDGSEVRDCGTEPMSPGPYSVSNWVPKESPAYGTCTPNRDHCLEFDVDSKDLQVEATPPAPPVLSPMPPPVPPITALASAVLATAGAISSSKLKLEDAVDTMDEWNSPPGNLQSSPQSEAGKNTSIPHGQEVDGGEEDFTDFSDTTDDEFEQIFASL